MAIANPLVIAYDAGNISLNRINQDAYGSEYYFRDSTQDFRVKIRHSTEKVGADNVVMERHNVELTHTVFSTTAGVPDVTEQIYFVLRNPKSRAAATVAKLGDMLTAFATNVHYQDLVAWIN